MSMLLDERLAKRQRVGNLRQLPPPFRDLIDFSSNDTLGMARSQDLMQAVLREWEQVSNLSISKLGSTGSRLLTGNSAYAEDLEHHIASFHGYQSGTLFSCGYMANAGLISTIACEKSIVIFDAQVHASVRDGIRLCRAACYPFRHNDLDHLEQRLKNSQESKERWIYIESLYSTEGSQAPLPEICDLANKYQARLIVDEAHAVGGYGPNGRGLVAAYNLSDQVFAQVVTFGKALGVHGAIVLGSATLKQALLNFSTPLIYTTALPLFSLAAIKCSYDVFPNMEEERRHLYNLIQQCRQANLSDSETHIQAVKIPGNKAVRQASQALANCGFDVKPLMSPTVSRGQESLRICLHAFNTEEQVAAILNELTIKNYAKQESSFGYLIRK